MANDLNEVLETLKERAIEQSSRSAGLDHASESGQGNEFVRSTAEQLEDWLVDLNNEDVTRVEFDEFVAEQKDKAAVFVAQQLDAQARAEKLTVNLLELAAEKIVPLILAA